MSKFLTEVLSRKLSDLELKEKKEPLEDLQKRLPKTPPGSFKAALQGNELKLIAEIKPRSPVLGQLSDSHIDALSRLQTYEKYAQAVSVLTEENYFGGSMDLLRAISTQCRLPLLMKDFVLSPYQLMEGRIAGASAALLIVKILSQDKLSALIELCKSLSMEPLLEVQNEEELERAQSFESELILINSRNLETLEIDLSMPIRLIKKAQRDNCIFIAASGIENADQLLELRPHFSRFLIGSALMKAESPESKFKEFLETEKLYKADACKGKSQCLP